MTAITTSATKSTSFAAPQCLRSGWVLRAAGALAVGALFCFGSAAQARADTNPPTAGSVTSCASATDGGVTCSQVGADTIVFSAPPLPLGADGAALPAAKATNLADVQSPTMTAPTARGLTPALAATLIAALVESSSSPAASQAPAAKAATVPATTAAPDASAARTSLTTVRVNGQTVSSLPGAKVGTQMKATVSCPTGKALVSGGATVMTSDGKNDNHALLSQSSATALGTWTAVGVVTDGNLSNGETLDVTAIALCN